MNNDRRIPVNKETITAYRNALLANQDAGSDFDLHIGLTACLIGARRYLQPFPVSLGLSNRIQGLK